MTAPRPDVYPLGDAAVVVRFGEEFDPDTHLALQAFARAVDHRAQSGIVECIPALTTVTVVYDPLQYLYEEVVQELRDLLVGLRVDPSTAEVPTIEIPVCYESDFGPDLGVVGSHNGLSPERVVEIHSAAEYLVQMIGFVPGFPYLGGLDPRIATPRRDSPRPKVPGGSIGIAGNQTGIYPSETPGGWQLIGRTPLRLFASDRDPPSLLRAGDRVVFVAISRNDFERLAEDD